MLATESPGSGGLIVFRKILVPTDFSKTASIATDVAFDIAKKSGATGGKISGAGGGGFMTFYCPDNTKYNVIENLNKFGGYVKSYLFVDHGMTSWTI